MSEGPVLTVPFWRSRKSAAVAGILFALLLLAAMNMMRIALSGASLSTLRSDESGLRLIRLSLNLVPFAGIAFLWFIGVVREQLGRVEDRLFSTVFLGSGLLFLAMLFAGAATVSSLTELLAGPRVDLELWKYGNNSTTGLISIYAMRMAAVFTISVSSVGLRASALPRWVFYLGYVVALVLLVAGGKQDYAPQVFPVWVLVVSVTILFSHRRGITPAES